MINPAHSKGLSWTLRVLALGPRFAGFDVRGARIGRCNACIWSNNYQDETPRAPPAGLSDTATALGGPHLRLCSPSSQQREMLLQVQRRTYSEHKTHRETTAGPLAHKVTASGSRNASRNAPQPRVNHRLGRGSNY